MLKRSGTLTIKEGDRLIPAAKKPLSVILAGLAVD